MGKEQIISKGKYAYAQPENIVSVKQYLFVREEDGKKRLLLRFANERQEICSKFAFILYRLDAKGNVLGQDKYDSADRDFSENEVFAFDRKIVVEEKCTDFKIQMVYARYGDYTYNVEHNNVSVAYSEKNTARLRHASSISKVKPRKIHSRTFDMPWFFAVLSVIILALAFAACGFLLKDYKEKEIDFTLAGVSYRFVDKDKKDDVVIMGCADAYREITLTNEIEGHKVVYIDEDAFSGNRSLVKLKIEGINIPAKAFEDCTNLEEVTINNVTSIGARAFDNCMELEVVTINEGKKGQLLNIGSRAFANCDNLTSVEINQTIVYGDTVDYFAKSTGVESLKLRNFAYTMKGVDSTYVTRLNKLFGETSTDKSKVKLESLVVENMDAIPEGFVRGFIHLESVTVSGKEIKSVGDYAFADCNSLSTLSLKGQLTSIGDYAFMGTDITSVDFSKVNSLGVGVFKDNQKLESVKNFGAGGLDSIPRSTFEGCTSLSTFTFNKNIKHIFADAFKGAGLTKISIPEGVSYDAGILRDCKKLAELEVYEFGSAGFVGQLFGADRNDSSDEVSGYIPKTLVKVTLGTGKIINESAFKGCANVTTINLPSDIEAIGDNAFSGCKKLTVVDIPTDSTLLKTIGDEAFSGCAKLKYVPLLDSLERIGRGALKGCTSLESITLPFFGATPAFDDENETVSYVFGGAIPASIKEISLLDASVVELPEKAFANCSGVKTIIIPNSVVSIGAYAFEGCSALTKLGLSDGTSKDTGADLTKVFLVGAHAFDKCTSLSSVYFSDNIEIISSYAFAETGLTKIEIPETVTFIGDGIVNGCTKLGSITVPYLGATKGENGRLSYLFDGSVPDSVKAVQVLWLKENTVGAEAFASCAGLVSVTLPSGVEFVEESAFRGCSSLTGFDFSTVLGVGDSAFSGCTSLKAVDISGLLEIWDNAFKGCTGLTRVDLTKAMLIGTSAFEECSALEAVTFGEDIYQIGDSAFYGTALKSVNLPEGITVLNGHVFGMCQSLTSVTLPSTLTTIGNYAFMGTSLEEIAIPNGVTTIGSGAFKDTFIKNLTIPAGATSVGTSILEGCANVESLEFPLTDNMCWSSVSSYLFNTSFPQTLKKLTINGCTYGFIHDYAFSDATSLKEVIITAPIDEIYTGAFYGCEDLRYASLPASLESVADSAFAGCVRLYEISNASPANVKSPSLIAVTPSLEERAATVEKNGYKFACLDGQWYLVDYPDNESIVVEPITGVFDEYYIPANLFSYNSTIKTVELKGGAKGIGDGAFKNCYGITRVTLPDTVANIGDEAFYSCSQLESISMPKSLLTIGNYAFSYCSELNNVKIYEKVNSIGSDAFIGCSNLFDVYNASTLPLIAGSKDYGYVARRAVKVHTDMNEKSSVVVSIDKIGTFRRSGGDWLLIDGASVDNLVLGEFKYEDVTVKAYRIAENAFASKGVQTIVIKDAVKQIQYGAFTGCSSLVSLDCSENKSLVEIEGQAFSYCTALKSAILPSGVKTIGDYAFVGCTMLGSLKMPESLVNIKEGAFQNCTRLISVTLNENVKSIGIDAFFGCEYLLEVYDLSPSISISRGSSDNGMVAYYASAVYESTDMKLERKEQNGLKFIRGSSAWYLYDFEEKGEDILVIPNLGSDLIIMPYSILYGEFTGIVMPANIVSIRYGAIRDCYAFSNIFYVGTWEQWESVDGAYNYSGFQTVYYKENCVHYYSYNVWTYDENGNVTITPCAETNEITLEPSCYSFGERTYTCACEGCGYTRRETVDRLKHEFENDICKHCNETRVVLDKENVQGYIDSGKLTIDGFVYDEKLGAFVSTNKEIYSQSTLTISADQRMTLSISVEASCVVNYDYLYVYRNGIVSEILSGKEKASFEYILEEGETISVSFVKGYSSGTGNDCGYIRGVQIVEKIEQQSN